MIQNLPSSHSSNADGLSYLLLKHGNSFIAAKLSALFTLLLSRCLIPDRWRCIMVTPIHKAGPKDKCSNYRPKAITSCVGRVMEMIICKHLTDRLNAISPLRSTQHGFLPGFSVDTAGITFIDFLTRNIDDGKLVDVIFLDYAKAFDSVPHSVLLQKLRNHGITGSLLMWIADYLRNRTQTVRMNDVFLILYLYRVVCCKVPFSDLSSSLFSSMILTPL